MDDLLCLPMSKKVPYFIWYVCATVSSPPFPPFPPFPPSLSLLQLISHYYCYHAGGACCEGPVRPSTRHTFGVLSGQGNVGGMRAPCKVTPSSSTLPSPSPSPSPSPPPPHLLPLSSRLSSLPCSLGRHLYPGVLARLGACQFPASCAQQSLN